ncbi:MAG: dihydropteroate synthase [Paludibacteraceae bacterium]|jgi:dihydropteroate synthase|nr:dihydropteroate synthase [Paludibacteraceae bacterium]MDI9537657.1 dihydropteroate synthase [Bacteroidota bacterium]HHT60994.1 dihydropteroate synthase [Bacteroidales bacterium]MBP9039787.1 dihydropteroate synthase [Paludibacteraceae bacterium]HOA47105.1 dihydropteroate synthase [Paludibacteraceae bacterium]
MNHFITINGKILDVSRPIVMGIINITPDSFFTNSSKNFVEATEKAICEGASIIDIGGYSTRPMADFVNSEEEELRVCKALESIRKHFPDIPISIDTFRASVAKKVVEEFGVGIINDVSGGDLDSDMFATVAQLNVPYILTHSKGNPQTMQSLTDYKSVTYDVLDFFINKLHQLRQMGVKDIIIDPGFGFAKTIPQNYELLNNLRIFETLNCPILGGISRKTMIFRPLGITPDLALNGTTVLNTLLLREGASILRVHDVKEAMEAIKLFDCFQGNFIAENQN